MGPKNDGNVGFSGGIGIQHCGGGHNDKPDLTLQGMDFSVD